MPIRPRWDWLETMIINLAHGPDWLPTLIPFGAELVERWKDVALARKWGPEISQWDSAWPGWPRRFSTGQILGLCVALDLLEPGHPLRVFERPQLHVLKVTANHGVGVLNFAWLEL